MNQKKARALRRAAKIAAAQFPDVHSKVTYTTIVREWFAASPKQNVPGFATRLLRKLFGLKAKPTKPKEVCVKREFQDVLSSGWKFILRRLKARVRRKELRIDRYGMLQEVQS